MGGVTPGGEQLYLRASSGSAGSVLSSLRQASCQFHALFRELTLTLFAMPDIIPATDETEWEISLSKLRSL